MPKGTTWEIPKSKFTEVLGNLSASKLKCPVVDCSKEYDRQAEFKRHVGGAHLHPWRCYFCNGDYGRREDIIVHLKNQEGVIGEPVQGRDYNVVPQKDLEKRCKDLPFK